MDKSDSERGSRAQARLEEEGVMGWVKPAFDEIKDGRGGEVLQRRNHLVNAAPERAVNIRVRPPLTDRGHRAHAAPGRERGERQPSAGKTRAIPDRRWRPHRDSNRTEPANHNPATTHAKAEFARESGGADRQERLDRR
jgi:hypothetical protein